MDKRGQFYLITAIIIISLIIGIALVSNYTKTKGQVKIYDLGDELGIESGQVVDYGTFQKAEMDILLKDFTSLYSDYAGEEKNLYFIFGDEDEVILETYQEITTGTISVDIGAEGGTTSLEITDEGYATETLTPETEGEITTVTIIIEGIPHEFELEEGDNFYFIITQRIGGEQHLVTG